MDYLYLEKLCRDIGVKYSLNQPLAPHTTMKIGGCCDILVNADSESALCSIIGLCKAQGIPYFVLGRGSNVLVSGEGYRGCIILMGADFSRVEVNDDVITALAGASLKSVCMAALENGLSGLEFAYGIPGSVGGALYMNAGAYGGEMKDIVQSCRYIDEDGELREITADKLEFSYRHSFFSGKSCVIVSVTMRLKKGDKSAIKARMDELLQSRRDKQPLEFPSCGSTFKRPEGYFAAALIEECGLKGFSIGGAQVSEKHSGFVINRGGASFEDIMALVRHIQTVVMEKKGVKLECEMLILK